MKKLFLLLFISVLLHSCQNKEEQMFYNYMDEITIKAVNVSVKDLDFKIITLNKIGSVYAKDSLDLLTKHISELKKVLEEDDAFIKEKLEKKKEIELKKIKTTNLISKTTNSSTLSIYKQMADNEQDMIDSYQEIIDIKKKYWDERKLSLNKSLSRLEELKRDSNMVIANKYELKYSMHMPDTDLTNTFKGFAYTNGDNSKFIKIDY